MSDEVLTKTIRQVITECPFAGEGHRKVRARLRLEHDISSLLARTGCCA